MAMIRGTTPGHPSSSPPFANRASGSGFAQQDVDKALLDDLVERQKAPSPTDFSDDDLQALEQLCQRLSRPDTKDQQDRLHQLLEPQIRQRIEALMNQCYGSDHLPIERFLERLAPLASRIPSLARYIADIQDILSHSRSPHATAVAGNHPPAAAFNLPEDIVRLIALRLLRRATAAETRDGFNASINDLLNFGRVCKLFRDGAQSCALPQALALRLPFAGLPHWLRAFQAAIDEPLRTTDAPKDEKRWKLLNTVQQSLVLGYLEYANRRGRGSLSKGQQERVTRSGHIAPPRGDALIAYAHRVHLFPVSRQTGQVNEAADEHLLTWDGIARGVFSTDFATIGALVEMLIAVAADHQYNKTDTWKLSTPRTTFFLILIECVDISVHRLAAAEPRFDKSLLTSGGMAIAAILLAARATDGPLVIDGALIDATLKFLVHYTALGHAIPPSAQEALAQVIVRVGLHPQQAEMLRTCLEQANKAQPEPG